MNHRALPFLSLTILMYVTGCVGVNPGEQLINSAQLPPMPVAVSNNAVAAVTTPQGRYLVSFNGLLSGRQWNQTTAQTFILAPNATRWTRSGDVPGKEGRLASIAVAVGEHAYVFGGYTVAQDHSEVSLPLVHRFDPVTQAFTRLADMPVPVDDAVALVYQNRYIYLVSGWHDTANVNLVQLYDTENDAWIQATAYPGAPVFGHSGGIVGPELVVCGGVKIKTHTATPREFVMNTECFAGTIRQDNLRRIDWRSIESMPGEARYRMAAAGSENLKGVLFLGGSDNPYNYDGIGYNGDPSKPSNDVWLYDIEVDAWRHQGVQATASMDHRGLLETDVGFVTVGGMLQNQQVTPRVTTYELSRP